MDTAVGALTYSSERVESCFEEAMPLLQAHWREIAHYQDIPLDPDYASYRALDAAGALRTFCARDEGALVGYAVFVVRPNMHYRSSLQALQDILYLSPSHRGQGLQFIRWCDEQLKTEGVQAVYHHVKVSHNFGPALERIGYQLVDLIYTRRLD